MGYDITFHAISKDELQRYVFDVLSNPELALERAKEIDDDQETQQEIFSLYNNILEWMDCTPSEYEDFSETFSFGIAAISGYLHDFYYSRNFAVSFMDINVIKSFTTLPNSPLQNFRDSSNGFIETNYCGSGYIDNPQKVLDYLENNEIETGKNNLDSLRRLLSYCIENDLIFLEASDLVVPIEDASYTNIDRFRAHFLDNIND